jgi:hypothetical protein
MFLLKWYLITLAVTAIPIYLILFTQKAVRVVWIVLGLCLLSVFLSPFFLVDATDLGVRMVVIPIVIVFLSTIFLGLGFIAWGLVYFIYLMVMGILSLFGLEIKGI